MPFVFEEIDVERRGNTHCVRLKRRRMSESDLLKFGEELAQLIAEDNCRRLALARQVHTDLVRDALAVRRRPLVRLLRLTRRHQPPPRFFDIADPTLDEVHR